MIETIATSAIVTGILVFVFKESFKAKLALVTKDIDDLKKYQSKDYDKTSESIKAIWMELANIDDYIRHGIAHDIDSGSLSNLPLRPFQLAIQKEMVLLPDSLYEKTENCLNHLSAYWKESVNKIVREATLGGNASKSEEACREKVNEYLSALRSNFNDELSKLRIEYRSYVSDHSKKT